MLLSLSITFSEFEFPLPLSLSARLPINESIKCSFFAVILSDETLLQHVGPPRPRPPVTSTGGCPSPRPPPPVTSPGGCPSPTRVVAVLLSSALAVVIVPTSATAVAAVADAGDPDRRDSRCVVDEEGIHPADRSARRHLDT